MLYRTVDSIGVNSKRDNSYESNHSANITFLWSFLPKIWKVLLKSKHTTSKQCPRSHQFCAGRALRCVFWYRYRKSPKPLWKIRELTHEISSTKDGPRVLVHFMDILNALCVPIGRKPYRFCAKNSNVKGCSRWCSN